MGPQDYAERHPPTAHASVLRVERRATNGSTSDGVEKPDLAVVLGDENAAPPIEAHFTRPALALAAPADCE